MRFILLFLFSMSTEACKYIPDETPFDERLKAAPIAFKGIVTEVSEDGKTTRFKVFNWFNGEDKAKPEVITIDGLSDSYYTLKSNGTPCEIKFNVGDMWIYGGPNLSSPSKMLSKEIRGYL